MRNVPRWRLTARLIALLMAVVALAAVPGATARSGEDLVRGPLASTAKDIKDALAALPADSRSVRVAPFVCARDSHANGQFLARVLQEELVKLGVTVKNRAAVGVDGRFHVETDKTTKKSMVKVSITLTGNDGPIGEPFLLDFQEPEVTTLLFPDPYKKDNKPGDNAKPHFDGNRVMTSKTGQYAVEVLAVDSPTEKTLVKDYAAVKPRLDDGRAFVDIKRGQAYAVRLTNNSDQDAAVVLSIDGLHIHRFCKDDNGKPAIVPAHLLVRKKSTVVVLGWRTQPNKVSRFVVTDRDLGAWKSADVGPDEVGRIVAQFHHCWFRAENRPKDEPKPKEQDETSEGTNPRGALATGMGDKIDSPLKTLPMTVGRLRESIPVLYSRPTK